MVNAIRSPGSVLKPFVYGLALDEGLIHPASLLQDVPLAPRQMPQLAPLFSRMMLGKSKSDKIVTTLDAGLQRRL